MSSTRVRIWFYNIFLLTTKYYKKCGIPSWVKMQIQKYPQCNFAEKRCFFYSSNSFSNFLTSKYILTNSEPSSDSLRVTPFEWLPSSDCLRVAAFEWLPSSGCLRVAACEWLPASGCLRVAACEWLPASGCLRVAACEWLPASGCLWVAAWETIILMEYRVDLHVCACVFVVDFRCMHVGVLLTWCVCMCVVDFRCMHVRTSGVPVVVLVLTVKNSVIFQINQ